MTTSYSASLNSYCNVGPLLFIPGVNNDITGADSSNCLQNYPFTDLDAHIMMYQSLTNDKTLTDETSTVLPDNTIEINTSVYSTGHFYSEPVSILDGSNNSAMLATCGYVNEIETMWANFPAIHDVMMAGHDITSLKSIAFDNSALLLEASGNYLAIDGSGIILSDSQTSILTVKNQSISFNPVGEIVILPSENTAEHGYQPCSYGVKLDTYSLFHANLIFTSLAQTLCQGDCVSGNITYTIGSGKFPSVMTFPCVEISSANTLATLQFNNTDDLVHTVDGITFTGCPLVEGLTYTLLLKNVDASNNIIWLSNREVLINTKPTVCVQASPVAFAPNTYCLITVSQAPCVALVSGRNPNPYVVDFKGLNSTVMGVQ